MKERINEVQSGEEEDKKKNGGVRIAWKKKNDVQTFKIGKEQAEEWYERFAWSKI